MKRIREFGVGINVLPFAARNWSRWGCWTGSTRSECAPVSWSTPAGWQEIMRRPCGLAAGFTRPQISVHRGRLQGLLHRAVVERLGADAVRTGHRLIGFE
ncbi:hypothetical protein GCM10023088_07810 [Actinomadura verrucosospora]|uniref:hypothetical protein n=1 Tax=Actinomadura verrucosospora TaxID=46165 RepID=UPI0031F0517E